MAAVSCAEIRDLFSARVDDALSAPERAQLDTHLATCPECAREWRSFERSVALVRGIEPARAPVGFVDRVLAARPRPWYLRLGRRLLLPWPVKLPLEAAAIVLVAGLAILIVQGSPELRQAARAPVAPAPVSPPAPTSPPAPASPDERMTGRERRDRPSAEVPRRDALPDEAKDRASEPAPADARAQRPPASPAPALREAPRAAGESRARKADALEPLARQEMERSREAGGGHVASAPDAPAGAAAGQAAPAPAAPPAAAPQVAAPAPARALSKSRGALSDVTAAAASVRARLVPGDRVTAERAVGELVARAGGRIVSRADDGDAAVLELAVPAARWDELQHGLRALGALRLEEPRGERPDPLRITLRLER